MAIPVKEKGAGSARSALLTLIFFAAVGVCLYYLPLESEYTSLQDISVFEFIILTLAVFRITRLLVYDQVAQFIRDLWLNLREEPRNDGVILVHRTKPNTGFRRLMADLFGCPWCVGVWVALGSTAVYLFFPWTWFFWLFMAMAGVSSFIQITINGIGWKAEKAKLKVEKMNRED